jgi:hypothetical protein
VLLPCDAEKFRRGGAESESTAASTRGVGGAIFAVEGSVEFTKLVAAAITDCGRLIEAGAMKRPEAEVRPRSGVAGGASADSEGIATVAGGVCVCTMARDTIPGLTARLIATASLKIGEAIVGHGQRIEYLRARLLKMPSIWYKARLPLVVIKIYQAAIMNSLGNSGRSRKKFFDEMLPSNYDCYTKDFHAF